jgi:catechol 2,3-dioxygenase-like lactoylglutathione lyase family enzyme
VSNLDESLRFFRDLLGLEATPGFGRINRIKKLWLMEKTNREKEETLLGPRDGPDQQA